MPSGMTCAGLNGLDVEIDRRSDVRRWPGLRIQPEVTQDPSNHFALAWLDERDHLHLPAAPGAGQRIHLDDTLDELRPASATRGPAGRARVVDVIIRERLNGQRTTYRARRSRPLLSPAASRTLRSTLNPECRQPRISRTIRSSMRPRR